MATVKTVADKRVVAEQGVVLNQYVGPLNWEHYRIPASGLSNSQLTFANLVTLGTNRLYDSNFQIEYTIEVDLSATSYVGDAYNLERILRMHPFPLHWVTDQLRTNINGAACMVRPQESLPQRMMYWRQRVLDKACNYCPHTKAPQVMDSPISIHANCTWPQDYLNYQMKYGRNGSQDVGTPLKTVSFKYNGTNKIATITIREPVLCPPFNQRLDEIYQSPLFNITSIDIVYQLNDLRMMFEASTQTAVTLSDGANVLTTSVIDNLSPDNISIRITDANLCFNVASMPPGMTVPSMLQLPYYDNVCYVTNGDVLPGTVGEVPMTSGVYTLAQVPTAIYIFVSENQLYRSGGNLTNATYETSLCPIRNINITLGNNTQLLNTTSEYDRYQMALANGLEDVTWEEFTRPIITMPSTDTSTVALTRNYAQGQHCGKCMLRLIPGVDLLIPDKRLVGGTDAEQMVFQVRLTADVTGVPDTAQPFLSLWIMFEYCGVLTIEPVHASIDMIPLKTTPPIGSIDTVNSTSVDVASGGGEGTNPTGAGIFDIVGLVRKGYNTLKGVWNNPFVSKVRGRIDEALSDEPAQKGGRIYGGTIVGGSDILGKYYK